MTDVFSRQKRSYIMSRVKGRGNVATELALVEILRRHKIGGWRRRHRVFGSPDFVFPKPRVAVFIDGCFWHGCPHHGQMPKSNRTFWRNKLSRNMERDRHVTRTLRKLGWRIVRLWQHDLREPEQIVRRIDRLLRADV